MTIRAAWPKGDAKPQGLARPGWNCWRVAKAERMGVVVDGENYFAALAEVLPLARHSILMLGWEFDSRTRLVRTPDEPGELPREIGPLLDALARRNPQLAINVLIWDSALIYALKREFAGLVKMNWLTHPNLRFQLDSSHPIGASHHQKMVVIDNRLAFIGGLDITSQRWDSRDHLAGDSRRSDPAFPTYPPFHDVMAVLSGEIAGVLGDLCRDRWHSCSGERLALPLAAAEGPWPSGVEPRFSDIDVLVSRTSPPWDGAPSVREIERLTRDMIERARSLIYFENQYFASDRIADWLERRLARRNCPEIVGVGPGRPVSIMERSTMGVARARLLRRLRDIKCIRPAGFFFPKADGRDVKVHSKLTIVDDEILRIGSANFNNRSMGLDTECDITIEARGDPTIKNAIRAVRHDLMAEHTGRSAAEVAAAETVAGSMVGAIRALSSGRRKLSPLNPDDPSEIVQFLAESRIPDPDEPMESLMRLEAALPGSGGLPLALRIKVLAAFLAGLALLASLWALAPTEAWRLAKPWLHLMWELRGHPSAALASVPLTMILAALRVPIGIMVLAAALVFGPWLGTLAALAGALAGATIHYALGFMLERRRKRQARYRFHRIGQAVRRHGIAAIMLLRLLPAADFTLINLMAGRTGVPLRDFLVGTVFGMAPGLFAISVVGDRVLAVLLKPSAINIAVLAAATLVVIGAFFGLVNRLGRAQAPKRRQPKEA